jgi:recombination protein RecR
MYLEERLKDKNLKFTKIAQGIPMGVGFENVDITSLYKAFSGRVSI